MAALATAELIPDHGAAAEDEGFFRSRAFHDAEGVTHSLRVTGAGADIALAVVVREIPGSGRSDATGAYGYPGASIRAGGAAMAAADVDWAPTGLVSLFVRERVAGAPFLTSATERSRLQVHDPAQARRMRPRLREQVRSNERRGYRVETVAGQDTAQEDVGAFHDAYTETMRRAEAAGRYFFERSYFDTVLRSPNARLLLARSSAGEPVAGAIAVVSDGLLHYYLGATADRAVADSPFKNVVAAMLDLGDELGMPLNLGGGVRPGDGLERFKRGFANSELPFRTHEIVCDPEAYDALVAGRDDGGFFPAYRAG